MMTIEYLMHVTKDYLALWFIRGAIKCITWGVPCDYLKEAEDLQLRYMKVLYDTN